jgi:nitrous oxidase accessory protein NosD
MASIFRSWSGRASLVSLVLLSTLTSYTVAVARRSNPHGSNSHGSTIYVSAGQSIQNAINSAYPGQTISVGPGTYAEQLTIMTDGLQLVGNGAMLVPPQYPVTNTCTDLAGAGFGVAGNGTQAGICITGQDIVFGAFVQHRKVVSVGTPIKDVAVTGFTVQDFVGINIAVVGGMDVHVVQNTLLDANSYGVLSDGSTNTVIEANHVTSTGSLLFIATCADDVSGAKFLNNDASNYGTAHCVQTNGTYAYGNNINNTCWGFFVDPFIMDVQILHNDIGPSNPVCDDLQGAAALGVLLMGASDNTIQGNTIEGRSAHGGINAPGAGVLITDDPTSGATSNGNQIIDNVFMNNDVDILVETKGAGNVIQGNTCTTPANLCGH